MKMKLHCSRLQFRARRCLAADSERALLVECKHGLRAWNLMAKLRAAIALSGVLAFTMLSAHAQAPTEAAAPPPSAPAKLSAADLEKLLMPIALYPDALIATLLPACVYPLEIVQAARFLQDANNTSKIDQQPWDESVKAIAKIPAALKKLNDDLQWTIQLGEVFLNQDKDVMDMIQSLRSKAQKAGTLRSSDQQVVVVTNMVVEKTVEERVVVVTNTVVQIQPSPANPQVVYVPTYPPTVYYPPPSYVYDPLAPLITFGAGVAVGAIIANNCDWGHGGCYWGGSGGNYNAGGNTKIKVEGDVNIGSGNNNNVGSGNRPSQQPGKGQKWQPDANRVKSSGSPTSAKSMQARGYGSGSAGAAARPSTQPATGNRGGGAAASTRPSTPSAGARPSTPSASARPSTPSASTRPSTPSAATKPAASPSTRPSGGSPSAGARPSASPSAGSSSAFGGGGGGDRQASQRGASSRSGGGGGGGASRGGGGGGRGGGGGGGGGGGRGR